MDERLFRDLPIQIFNNQLLGRFCFGRHFLQFNLRVRIPAKENIASDHGSGSYEQRDDERQQQAAQEDTPHDYSTSNL